MNYLWSYIEKSTRMHLGEADRDHQRQIRLNSVRRNVLTKQRAIREDLIWSKVKNNVLSFIFWGILTIFQYFHKSLMVGEGTLMLKLWKYAKCVENYGLNICQYCFANISATKAQISMKFYMVVNYYRVSLSFKFHEDPCINARTRVVNACKHILSRVRALTNCARAFVHGSSWN